MKKRLASSVFALGLVLLNAPLLTTIAAQTNVAGKWDITLTTQAGETKWTATFEQDGATLSGEIDIGDREILPIEGTIEGSAIEFVFVIPDLDGDQPISMSGEVRGNTIKGDEGSFVGYGSGDWTGTKWDS